MIICYLTRGFYISCYFIFTEMLQVVRHYKKIYIFLFQQRVVIEQENVKSNEIDKKR